jgi:ribosomal-protein-alanine N-acetyltransferase
VTVILRDARPSDLGAIDRIERASFGNPWPLDAYAQEIERDHGILEVASIRGEGIVGFSCAWHVADEAHLLRIATAPRFRRRGIGRDLLSAVVARARAAACGRITLEVASANGAAIHLYEAYGFAEIGRRSGYYRVPPDDALVMRLEFTPVRSAASPAAEPPGQRWTPGSG